MTQKQIFDKITRAVKKGNKNKNVLAASKLVANWNRLSTRAKTAAKQAIKKAVEDIEKVRPSERIPQTFAELYAKFKKEYRGDLPVTKAWKAGTSGRDVVQDASRPALPKGKRTVKKKGYTSNQYGTFKNKVGTTYFENRNNRFDINEPVSRKKVKLAYGGKTEKTTKKPKLPTQKFWESLSQEEKNKLVFQYLADTGQADFDKYFAKGGNVNRFKIKNQYKDHSAEEIWIS